MSLADVMASGQVARLDAWVREAARSSRDFGELKDRARGVVSDSDLEASLRRIDSQITSEIMQLSQAAGPLQIVSLGKLRIMAEIALTGSNPLSSKAAEQTHVRFLLSGAMSPFRTDWTATFPYQTEPGYIAFQGKK